MSEKDFFCIEIGDVQIVPMFEPRDIWIGVYWNREDDYNEFYVCLLPMLPIRFLWGRHSENCAQVTQERGEPKNSELGGENEQG